MTKFSALHFLRPLGLSLLMAVCIPFSTQAQINVKARSADFIVAVVNSEPITNNEVQALKSRLGLIEKTGRTFKRLWPRRCR
jgi:hypothetical protein